MDKKLEACRKAIKEKGSDEQIIMQGTFIGLPRSGKTTTKERLIGRVPALQQPSTGVAEKVSHVEIERTTVQLVSHCIWNEVTDLNEEAAMVVEDIAGSTIPQSEGDSKEDQTQSSAAPEIREQLSPQRQSLVQKIVQKVKSMFQQRHGTPNIQVRHHLSMKYNSLQKHRNLPIQ